MTQAWKVLALLPLFALASRTCPAQKPNAYHLSGDIAGTHDPSIIKEGKTWYVFCDRQSPGRRADCGSLFGGSRALEVVRPCLRCHSRVDSKARSPGTRDLWAPDISCIHHEYRLYYAYSLFGKNTSGIALATNKSLDPADSRFKRVDRGVVLESKAGDNFNAIDPNFVCDARGGEWLVFGSFWDGIKMRPLNDSGLLSTKDIAIYPLARRAKPVEAAIASAGLPANWQAIETPFLVLHGGYFYLFTSWDLCCRGLKSTYKTMVRSKSITGPYVDANGRELANGGGTALLLPNSRWLGPGGGSVYLDSHKRSLIVFHAYDSKTGKPSMQLSSIDWTGGWPHADLEQ